jgi:hypothetical protein
VNGESPDLEIAAGARAASIQWRKGARSRTRTSEDVKAEEVIERRGAPEHPEPGRKYKHVARGWGLAATLREALKHKRN